MAAAPFGFGSAELFLNPAACVPGNLRRAVELQTNSAPPAGGMEMVGVCRAAGLPRPLAGSALRRLIACVCRSIPQSGACI
jgi:hypothetical protein